MLCLVCVVVLWLCLNFVGFVVFGRILFMCVFRLCCVVLVWLGCVGFDLILICSVVLCCVCCVAFCDVELCSVLVCCCVCVVALCCFVVSWLVLCWCV